ncbi:MAG: transposase [Acidobacteria bacterium]|nr:transposase [Acidobacteriota bacterium]
MQDSRMGSRLKAQLSKFTRELTAGLSKPIRQFVGEMLFGIQASQQVKLSQMARSLQEEIPLIKTEDRLLRNLAAACLEGHWAERLAELGSKPVESNTVLCLDRSEVRKEYAEKRECLDPVWDGSQGEVHAGYGLCGVTAAEVEGSQIRPLTQKLFSTRAKDFVSENAEIRAAVDQVRRFTKGRGIWAVDRGGDRKKLREPLLEKKDRFVIRSTGQRSVINRQQRRMTVPSLSSRCRLRYQARLVGIEDGKEKRYELRYGAEPFRLPGREEKLLLVVVAGFGTEPLLRLTNREGVRDSSSLWWIVRLYLTRWKMEETFRFVKQSYHLEDIRVLRYQRLKNLILLVTAAAYFATTFLGQKMKLKILCEKLLIISRRFFGIPPFRFYALADGIQRLLFRSAPPIDDEPPNTSQLELLLGWNP